jgi:hypothetical protein
METLIKKFKQWEITNENGLTMAECMTIMENEHLVDYSTFQDVMDYRDYLELECA